MPTARARRLAVAAHAGYLPLGLLCGLAQILWSDDAVLSSIVYGLPTGLLIASPFGIVIALAVRRFSGDDPWLRAHIAEALVLHKTLLLWYLAGAVLFIVFIGGIIIFLAFLVCTAQMLEAANAAWAGEPFEYRQVLRDVTLRRRRPPTATDPGHTGAGA